MHLYCSDLLDRILIVRNQDYSEPCHTPVVDPDVEMVAYEQQLTPSNPSDTEVKVKEEDVDSVTSGSGQVTQGQTSVTGQVPDAVVPQTGQIHPNLCAMMENQDEDTTLLMTCETEGASPVLDVLNTDNKSVAYDYLASYCTMYNFNKHVFSSKHSDNRCSDAKSESFVYYS